MIELLKPVEASRAVRGIPVLNILIIDAVTVTLDERNLSPYCLLVGSVSRFKRATCL